MREKFDLPNVSQYIAQGSSIASSVVDYINQQMKVSIDWDDAARLVEEWNGPFAVKGVMSVDDAKRCVEIGASAIMISNHGGRQLDGSRAPFDQLPAIADAVGGQIELIVDGGIRRGTHVLKALAAGATACSGGRMYLYALAGAGRAGVARAMRLIRDEIERINRHEGIEISDDDDLRRVDRNRPGKKVSNKDWKSPTDPDSRDYSLSGKFTDGDLMKFKIFRQLLCGHDLGQNRISRMKAFFICKAMGWCFFLNTPKVD